MYQYAIKHIENVVQIEIKKGIFDSSAALDYDFLKSVIFKKSFQKRYVNQKASKIINKYDTIHFKSKEVKLICKHKCLISKSIIHLPNIHRKKLIWLPKVAMRMRKMF